MKVLQMIDSLSTGGGEMMAVRIANLLAENGMESYLVSTRAEGPLKDMINPGVKYFFLSKKNTFDPVAAWRFIRLVKKNQIDIVHAHSTSVFWASMLKFLIPSVKLIWHDHHGIPVNKRPNFSTLKKIQSKIDFLISVSPEQLENDRKHLIFNERNSIFLRNFAYVNPEFIQNHREKNIVQVANFRSIKNQILIIEAFQLIAEQFPDWKLFLIGKNSFDSYSKHLQEKIRLYGLENQIFMIGNESNISKYLGKAMIGALSSKAEGLPVAILEYGLAGLAVVSTDVGGIHEVIKDGKTGLLVPPDDVKAFSKALKTLMENHELRSQMASNLNHLVNKKFSAQNYLINLKRIYKSLL